MASRIQRMVQKKGIKSIKVIRDAGRDYAINKLLNLYNIQYGVLLYDIIMLNPIDIALSIIALKLGINKMLLGLIIAFLL